MSAESVFERRNGHFVATELARGPWDPAAQHGGAPAALLMRAFEELPAGDGLMLSRVTYERLPSGDWIALDARTTIAEGGVGIAESVLYDERGCVGRAVQALLVAPRSAQAPA
jgi:hypothetical protein